MVSGWSWAMRLLATLRQSVLRSSSATRGEWRSAGTGSGRGSSRFRRRRRGGRPGCDRRSGRLSGGRSSATRNSDVTDHITECRVQASVGAPLRRWRSEWCRVSRGNLDAVSTRCAVRARSKSVSAWRISSSALTATDAIQAVDELADGLTASSAGAIHRCCSLVVGGGRGQHRCPGQQTLQFGSGAARCAAARTSIDKGSQLARSVSSNRSTAEQTSEPVSRRNSIHAEVSTRITLYSCASHRGRRPSRFPASTGPRRGRGVRRPCGAGQG